mmetsp:Transcript_36334/g.84984  ORF Transcript_36334/g.84984 Transcript_36334/m.84984 type:complete len:478 (-) Transcript_36334:11-1444(-)
MSNKIFVDNGERHKDVAPIAMHAEKRIKHSPQCSSGDIGRDVSDAIFVTPRRFIRINALWHPDDCTVDETIQKLSQEIASNADNNNRSKQSYVSSGPIVRRVSWLGCSSPALRFYSLPGELQLSSLPSYQRGLFYGMDANSGAAVHALLHDVLDIPDSSSQPLNVLDLCSAPGLKLCAIFDFLTSVSGGGSVTGIDVSEERTSVTVSILRRTIVRPIADRIRLTPSNGHIPSQQEVERAVRKYPNVRIFRGDGTKLIGENKEKGPPSQLQLAFDLHSELVETVCRSRKDDGRKKMNRSARAREQRRLRAISNNALDFIHPGFFDRVLVDAECSSDGRDAYLSSLCEEVGGKIGEIKGPKRTHGRSLEYTELKFLQQGLIGEAFGLLRQGGTMVYSTCSTRMEENEDIVTHLLENEKGGDKGAYLLSPPDFVGKGLNLMSEGLLKDTLRFKPNLGRDGDDTMTGGGFFLAKIGKAKIK